MIEGRWLLLCFMGAFVNQTIEIEWTLTETEDSLTLNSPSWSIGQRSQQYRPDKWRQSWSTVTFNRCICMYVYVCLYVLMSPTCTKCPLWSQYWMRFLACTFTINWFESSRANKSLGWSTQSGLLPTPDRLRWISTQAFTRLRKTSYNLSKLNGNQGIRGPVLAYFSLQRSLTRTICRTQAFASNRVSRRHSPATNPTSEHWRKANLNLEMRMDCA